MFKKLVACEPLNLPEGFEAQLKGLTQELVMYDTVPENDDEILSRIKDADGVLIMLSVKLPKKVLENCPNLKYIGLCSTLYEDGSCNVDLKTAREMGISVTGVSDYGDEGIPEFVVSYLADFLHGFRGKMWRDYPLELTGLNIGIFGMGTTAQMVSNALKFFGANIFYYSRTRKPHLEDDRLSYLEIDALLEKCDIVVSCLNKNVHILTENHLKSWTGNKILFNISLSPCYKAGLIEKWLDDGNNLFCDSLMALGDESLRSRPNVSCPGQFAGRSLQSQHRLYNGVINNIKGYLK